MKKSTANSGTMAIFLVIALLLLIPMNTYSTSQSAPELEAEMEHLVDILAQMDNGSLERPEEIYYGIRG